jgi:hypothetical protein
MKAPERTDETGRRALALCLLHSWRTGSRFSLDIPLRCVVPWVMCAATAMPAKTIPGIRPIPSLHLFNGFMLFSICYVALVVSWLIDCFLAS